MSFSFYKNIEYIINNDHGSLIVSLNETIQVSNRALYIIELILNANLMSAQSYNKGIKYLTNYKYNIPIVINHTFALLQSKANKNYETIWINYNQVSHIDNENYIIFKSGKKIKFNNSLNYYENQINKINMILQLDLFNNK